MKRLILSLGFILFSIIILAEKGTFSSGDSANIQKDSLCCQHPHTRTIVFAEGTMYTAAMIGLYNYKYRGNLHPQFRMNLVKDDWRLGVDVFRHSPATYYLGSMNFYILRMAGISERRATWIGGLSGLCVLTSQEIMDGFSSKWGASLGDFSADVFGSALFISQQLVWHDQKLTLKWSFHSTTFPKYNPELLGRNFIQQMINDYNGQTIWLSANLFSLSGYNWKIPAWLNLAIGYGATGMTGPITNTQVYLDDPFPQFATRPLFYIAPDIDLTRIHTHSTTLRWIFKAVSILKFPLPALEISSQGAKFHPLFF